MRSSYRPIGNYIRLVDERNNGLHTTNLLGVSISKQFIKSVANVIGTDMENYKIIRKNQFACSIMQVRRDRKMPVALYTKDEPSLISQAYPVFEIINAEELLPEYLMMWFTRSEFDREACFYAVGGVRGSLEWEDFCNMQLPIPSPEKQLEIVREYNVIQSRIKLNNQLIAKLEETAQAIYKQWFVDFEFHNENGLPYKSSGGEMVGSELGEIPKGWDVGRLGDITKIIMGQSPKGDSYNTEGIGTPLVNGPVEFGEYFTEKTKWTTSVTKLSEIDDLIICVRGSTTGRFVKSDGFYCLGRGVCSLRAFHSQRFVDQVYQNSLQKLLALTTGSTFPNWDRLTLSNFLIIIPSRDLMEEYEKKISLVFGLIESKHKEIIIINNIKKVLFAKMTKVEFENEFA
ncbi:restriction endonuclease subunit S [Pedobacter sp. D749]|uniref:restriction endonuclease subunit S n=1 Tax=Pedobacter sp. D749 TaxID=2856523 RepID=UPI001C574CAA|nr:restriction endonuclease subunit S [Pedobacter sp. D749]QXU42961.1 restriction endonuclease subunit S [Pedobacter sp. D749]